MSNVKEQQLNVEVPDNLYREVKKAAIDGQMKLRKFVEFILGLGLYIVKSLGFSETFKIVRENQPLAFLIVARNELSKMGFNTSRLNQIIMEVEVFLEKKGRK